MSQLAAEKLRNLLDERGLSSPNGLRLSVSKGGCAGLEYAMSIAKEQPGDLVVERDGAHLYVAEDALPFLDGSTLDYADDLAGSGFRVNNPKAVRHCGCGTSFEAPAKNG